MITGEHENSAGCIPLIPSEGKVKTCEMEQQRTVEIPYENTSTNLVTINN
jgi:hypothetical protein